MKKGFLGAVLTSAMVVSMLAGCSSKKASSTAASAKSSDNGKGYEDCTITFSWWGGDKRHEATQEAIKAFEEKYPGIKVEPTFGAWTDWEKARALEFKNGTAADLVQINFSWIPDYDAQGQTFVDLNTLKDTIDLSQFDEKTLDMCKDSKGGLAGIPVSMTGRTFFWNETTFEKAGIDTPKTLDDLMNAGKVFKEKLGDDYYPLSLGEYDRALFMSFYLQAKSGEPIISEDGKLNVSEEDLADGIKFIQSLEENHVIPTLKTLAGDGNVALNENPNFINGKYAGVFEWDSTPGKYTSNLAEGQKLVVGQELEGLGDKASGVSTKVSQLFATTQTSQHPKEAAMLLNFLLNEDEGIKILKTERGIPASKHAYDLLQKEGMVDDLVKSAHESIMAADPMYFSPKFDNAKLKGNNAAYIDVFSGVSYGEYSVEDGAKTLYDTYKEVCGD